MEPGVRPRSADASSGPRSFRLTLDSLTLDEIALLTDLGVDWIAAMLDAELALLASGGTFADYLEAGERVVGSLGPSGPAALLVVAVCREIPDVTGDELAERINRGEWRLVLTVNDTGVNRT